ncbi:MAG: hypothetical protein DMG83_08230 [Acidobacteria bacterium]|nr:MAG: hypothetical protein DMG83_08230 [Acidobacteriota bacterium]
MPRAKINPDKQKALQQHGTLNLRPQDVRHPLFQDSDFFDPFAFQQGGLSGLLPQKRGPRNGHKLTPEVMEFVGEQRTVEPSLSFAQLAERVQHNFHVKVHPRSIERQLLREKKLR